MRCEPTITLAMIVCNEEEHLAKCLDSVKEAVNEMVIVDTGSNDNTRAIAQRYTDKIYDYVWDGDFSAARNFAISKSTGQWILVLDADEVLDISSGGLRQAIMDNDTAEALFLPLRCLRDEALPNEYNHFVVLRLFRNTPDYCFTGKIHEQVTLPYPEAVRFAEYPVIWHKPVSVKERNSKRNRNLRLLQIALQHDPENCFLQYYLGVEWLGLGKIHKALPLFTEVCGQLSEEKILFRAPAVTGLIICLRQAQRLAEALEVCINECRKYPEYTDLFFDAGTILEEQGNYLQAIGCFQTALARGVPPAVFAHTQGTESFLSLQHLGCCYEYLGESKQAELYYQQALKANPDYLEPLYNVFCLKLEELGAKGVFDYVRQCGYLQNASYIRILGQMFFKDSPDLAAACYAEAVEQDLSYQVKSLIFCGEIQQAINVINIAKANKVILPPDIGACEIIAGILIEDYEQARRLALKMWRVSESRNAAWGLLMLLSHYECGYSKVQPEKTREPEVVQTLLAILDDCLRYKPRNLSMTNNAAYVQLATKITSCLTAWTAESNLALISYLKAKQEASRNILAYRYQAPGCLYHG